MQAPGARSPAAIARTNPASIIAPPARVDPALAGPSRTFDSSRIPRGRRPGAPDGAPGRMIPPKERPMRTRRGFLRGLAGGTAALSAFRAGSLEAMLSAGRAAAGRPAVEVAADEDWWREAQGAFTVDRSLIN